MRGEGRKRPRSGCAPTDRCLDGIPGGSHAGTVRMVEMGIALIQLIEAEAGWHGLL